MRQYTEAPPQDPSTDGDRPLLQPAFGPAEPDRHDDQADVGDTVDGRTADPAQPEDQPYADQQAADRQAADDRRRDAVARQDEQPDGAVADDEPHGERRMDGQGDVHPEGDASTTHDDVEPAAFDGSARPDPAFDGPADEPAAGAGAAGPASPDEPTDFKPGDVAVAAVTAIWTEDSVQDMRDRWREAQLRFVDDPHKAANETRDLVNEAVEALTAALASHREQLNSWPVNGDTEQYRMVVQRYRTFFERLLTL